MGKHKKVIKTASAVLAQMFAMAMAAVLLLVAMRYVVFHKYYGTYMVSPYEQAQTFEDTQIFQYVLQRDLMNLSHYLALCSQLESDGEYDQDRRVDVFRYVNRRNTSADLNEYPKLEYRVGDLVEWFQYGISWWDADEMSYEEAKQYLSQKQMEEQMQEQTGIRPGEEMSPENYLYQVCVLEEEFAPQNVESVYDLELPAGMSMQDVMMAIQKTAEDLHTNYYEYVEKKEMLSSDCNLKYMYVAPDGETVYTNLENKENLSADELKQAFVQCKTYMVYDYSNNDFISNNLMADHVPGYKQYFRNYDYCFTHGGTVYVALQTKSSSAFGPYNNGDFYALADANLKTSDASWENMLGFSAALGLLSLISLVLFVGHQPKKKREELRYFDCWFTEIALAFAALTTCAVIGFGALTVSACLDGNMLSGLSSEQTRMVFGISVFVTFSFLYLLFLFYMGSLARRIKARALWKRSLCYYLLHNTKRFCGKLLTLIRRVVEELVNNKMFFVRTFGPYCMFLFMNVTLILVFRAIGIFLACIFDVAVAVYIYYENKAREEIVEGISRICDGEVEYQIDTSRFFGENKVMGEAVNRIGDAVKTAVEISMKDERLKADLITNVSHDIKTPLTSIINYVDLLKRENVPGEKAQEYIRILDEKSQRLKQLTLDLVEASKISSGNITLEMSNLHVNELLVQAMGEYRDKMEEKKLVPVESYPDTDVVIWADSRHMWRVVENLILNICKYAMEGTRVYVDVVLQPDKVEIVLKNISAQPLNIPAEELTERFIRGDVSRSTEGSGLGLSIARNLTEAQGGEFTIHLDGDLFKVVLVFPRN